jgi:hypothetical protein
MLIIFRNSVKNEDAIEVLHEPLVTVIDHIPDLVAHVDHVLDHEIDVEDIGVGLGRVRDDDEVEPVLEKGGGRVVVHVEEVVVEVDIGTFIIKYRTLNIIHICN